MSVLCKQKTAYEMRISDWSSDVCSSDLIDPQEMAKYQAALIGPNIALPLRQRAAVLGREMTANDVETFTLLVAENAKNCSGTAYAEAQLYIPQKIARASGRERVYQYVSIPVVAVSLKYKQ